ncbi:MAG: carbon-nitrogen hydrolase family protein [Alphaproteobacteria bacterium]
MSHFAIAGIQMHVGMEDNSDLMRQRLNLLMHLYPWTEMVLFSELCAHGPQPASAEKAGGAYEEALSSMALKHKLWIVGGSYFEKADGALYNTTPVIGPNGEVVTRYRKMFPFTPFENETTPGSDFCVFDVPEVGRFGVSICYDVWFPEVTRTLVAMGAEVILNPVLAHFVDRDMDLVVARASAAMFQSYVFHINGTGAGGNGQSIVADPSGRILHQAGVSDELIPVEVDLDLVRRQRERGLRNMGQPLKSFRDSQTNFSVYDRARFDHSYLQSLGPLAKPARAALAAGGEPESADVTTMASTSVLDAAVMVDDVPPSPAAEIPKGHRVTGD